MTTAIAVAATFLVSLAAPLIFRPLLHRLGVVDVPNERSSHSRPTVRGVGLAPMVGMLIGYGILLTPEGTDNRELLFALLAVPVAAGVLGLVEDTLGLAVRVRAGVQVLLGLGGAAAVIALAGASWWLLPIFAIAIAGYINVANFMDGINGISGLHGAIVGGAYAVAGVLVALPWLIAAGSVVALAFLAFLPWNLGRGNMFLGDVGSYLLGGAVSIIAVASLVNGVPALVVIGPLAIYLADTGFTLLRRVSRGERFFEAHRGHIYQRMCGLGHSHTKAATIVTGVTGLCSSFGLLSLAPSPIGALVATVGMVMTALGYLTLPRLLSRRSLRAIQPAGEGASQSAPRSDLPNEAEGSFRARWAVVGATGFVGSALVEELRQRGLDVVEITAPRVSLDPASTPAMVLSQLEQHQRHVTSLARRIGNVGVVVNAAGLAAPDATGGPVLYGANALLPVLIAAASGQAGSARYVHLSSAAVQGRRQVLDESVDTAPFSPYSRSKALGEASLLEYLRRFDTPRSPEVVVLRATSVQGRGRATTARLQRVARSPIASVARPGDRRTVVSSLRGLIQFVATVGAYPVSVPTIVLQPWEGLTTSQVLKLAGGRAPKQIPPFLCRTAIAVGYSIGAIVHPMRGIVRRIEVMWMGQAQNAVWAGSVSLETHPFDHDVFKDLEQESSAFVGLPSAAAKTSDHD